MMNKFVFLVTFTIYLFAYDKTADDKNVYYTSDHFRTVMGVSYKDSTAMENFSDKLLNAAELSWQKEIVELGFKMPRNSNTKKIDIYIGNKSAYNYETSSYETISNSYAGWATSYPSDNTPYFLINNILTDDQIKVTISHEFFHTIQYAYFDETKLSDDKWFSNIWWLEATAVLMEDEVYDDIDDYLGFLNPFFDRSYRSFEIYDGSHEYSMVIFAKYIKEKYGMQIIKDTLSSIETSGDDGYYEILDKLLQESYSSSMKDSLLEFAKWVSNKDKYFEEGSSYPNLRKFQATDTSIIRKGGIKVIENLNSGWNMVSLPSGSISNLDVGQRAIWTYKDGIWSNNVVFSGYNQIEDTNSSNGYWVDINNSSSIYYTYYDNMQLDLSSQENGWSLVSTNNTINMDSFTDFSYVWYYKDSNWYLYSNDGIDYSEYFNILEKIDAYSSFWVYK